MNFKAIRKLDTGLARSGGDLIHRMALFPKELWSLQVIWGLEWENASPASLKDLWPIPAQPAPDWVLADGLENDHPILG